MKRAPGLMLWLVATSACAIQVSEDQRTMTLIERAVDLPEGSKPIEQYSRYYASRPDGKIIAIYVLPIEPPTDEVEDYGCEVMLEDFESRPCNEDEIAEMAQQDEAAASIFDVADKSRWFDNYLELPAIMDGGCSQVTIIFDPSSKDIESADCNGLA